MKGRWWDGPGEKWKELAALAAVAPAVLLVPCLANKAGRFCRAFCRRAHFFRFLPQGKACAARVGEVLRDLGEMEGGWGVWV